MSHLDARREGCMNFNLTQYLLCLSVGHRFRVSLTRIAIGLLVGLAVAGCSSDQLSDLRNYAQLAKPNTRKKAATKLKPAIQRSGMFIL